MNKMDEAIKKVKKSDVREFNYLINKIVEKSHGNDRVIKIKNKKESLDERDSRE